MMLLPHPTPPLGFWGPFSIPGAPANTETIAEHPPTSCGPIAEPLGGTSPSL